MTQGGLPPTERLGIDTLLGPDAPFRQMLADYPALGGKLPSADDAADRPASTPRRFWRH